jgi:CxxC-x17-CxxC domain-containing protein
MSFQDKTLTCIDCGDSFTFSADDQQYHAEKGYANEPKRCPGCRSNRRSGGSNGYSTGYGNGGYQAREMHPATCAQCGKSTEVPFLPRGDRPVYCSDCFNKQPQKPANRRW